MSDIRLEGVSKRYGPVAAADNVDLAVAQGEFVTILGPSGSGKTTLLSLIAGLNRPTAGRIFIGGRDVTDAPAQERNIGLVFQSYALFPHMTVLENVLFPLGVRKIGGAVARTQALDALRLVRLEGLEDRRPSQLSGGQQQRVALARAIVFKPDILLLDEPLGALDRKLREQLQLEIKRVHRERGISVLYVTHDQEEALTMSDRIAVFNKGRIEQIGTPEELYDRPATRFVASFIGDTNLIEGRVLGIANGVCEIQTAAGRIAASTRTPLEAGAAVFVAVRPERVFLAPRQAGGAGLEGVVVEQVFLGTSRKYVVRLVDGTELVVLRPISDPPFDQASPTVRLSWAPDKATAFSA